MHVYVVKLVFVLSLLLESTSCAALGIRCVVLCQYTNSHDSMCPHESVMVDCCCCSSKNMHIVSVVMSGLHSPAKPFIIYLA